MKKISLIIAAIGLVFSGAAAQAGEPKLIGSFGDWSAYYYYENGSRICYMASTPAKAEGNYKIRGDIFAFITHRIADKVENEFNYIAGYPYKDGFVPTVKIDNKKFSLYVNGEVAWANDVETDESIAKALRKGSKMVVNGKSSRGTLTTDTYSLKGSSKAHDAINKECGVK